LKTCFCLVFIFLLGITSATAADTIANMWGTVHYGWIDTEAFGIQFQGSEQIRQIEQDWPKSALLITNHAHRFSDNLFAWQVRKSAEGEVLLVIPNDFTKAQSYYPDAQPSETQEQEDISYSECQVTLSRILDSHKIIAEGDLIEIHLSWGQEHLLFSFSIPGLPAPLELPIESAPEVTESP